MKEKISKAFKETPERFSYNIESTLSEVKLIKRRKRRSTPLRIVVAVMLILAILPSAVFGAVKMCGAIAQRVGNYGVAFDISINEEAPKYVKMNIDVPKGFREQPNSEGLKFDRDSEEWEFGFTILPMRFYESVDYTALEKDVLEYNEMKIASRPSYELINTEGYLGVRRYYVWYEEANVLILIYRGETVTDRELKTFVDSISFTEGTENDHDSFFEPENNGADSSDDTAYYEYEKYFTQMPNDTKITFLGCNEDTGETELKVESVITDIRITDNINGLDKSDINSMFETDEIADKNGKLLPKTVEIWREGDGVNTETKMLSSESKEQKLVLIDIEYTNTTDSEVSLYIPYRMETLIKDTNGRYKHATEIDKAKGIYASVYCDGEIFYMSSHGEKVKDFYIPILQPHETRTITLGFRCVDEQLSNAYLIMNPETDGVISPDYSDIPNTYFIFKVQ